MHPIGLGRRLRQRRRTSRAATTIRRAGRRRRRRSAPGMGGRVARGARLRAASAAAVRPLPAGGAPRGARRLRARRLLAGLRPRRLVASRRRAAGARLGGGDARATCWRPRRGSPAITGDDRARRSPRRRRRWRGRSGWPGIRRAGIWWRGRSAPTAGCPRRCWRGSSGWWRSAGCTTSARCCGSQLNETLRLDAAEARGGEPGAARAAARGGAGARLGRAPASGRSSCARATLLANVWTGLGADMALTIEPGRHHFDVIDGARPTRARRWSRRWSGRRA